MEGIAEIIGCLQVIVLTAAGEKLFLCRKLILSETESFIHSPDSDKGVDHFHGMWKSFQLIKYLLLHSWTNRPSHVND